MINIGVVGLGKMGLSHLSILGAHPLVQVNGVCDSSRFVRSALSKYSDFPVYSDYTKMLNSQKFDGIVVAVPTKLHKEFVLKAIEKNVHVFCEKPFALQYSDALEMQKAADDRALVTQVGYHNRFIGTFRAAKKILDEGHIGKVHHIIGQAHGPVVINPKSGTWRSNPAEGGGCLLDYASHVINLIDYIVGPPASVAGTIFKKIFSKNVEDMVMASLIFPKGVTGSLHVNWSDESYRKMSTNIEILGSEGKIICDSQQCKVFLSSRSTGETYQKGWNSLWITDQTDPVFFNLRGEEYSSQLDYFISSIENGNLDGMNSFSSAINTDLITNLLKQDARGES